MICDITDFLLKGQLPLHTEAMKRLEARAALAEENLRVLAEKKLQDLENPQPELFPKPVLEGYVLGANALVRAAIFSNWGRYAVANRVWTYEKAVSLKLSGAGVNQFDYDVFLILLNARTVCEINPESFFEFRKYAMLKALGWPVSSYYYELLDGCLDRLGGCLLDLTVEDKEGRPGWRFLGSLITVTRETRTQNGLVQVMMHPHLSRFFQSGRYHHENMAQRKALGKMQLAKALHAFYSSHLQPIPLPLVLLRSLLGTSEDTPEYRFKQQIKQALNALVNVDFLHDYSIYQTPQGVKVKVTRRFEKSEIKLLETMGSTERADSTVFNAMHSINHLLGDTVSEARAIIKGVTQSDAKKWRRLK